MISNYPSAPAGPRRCRSMKFNLMWSPTVPSQHIAGILWMFSSFGMVWGMRQNVQQKETAVCSCDSCVQSYLPFWIAQKSFITYISLQRCYHSNLLFKYSFASKCTVWTALQSEMHEKTELESKEVTYHLTHETLEQDVMLTPRENKIYHKSPRSYS